MDRWIGGWMNKLEQRAGCSLWKGGAAVAWEWGVTPTFRFTCRIHSELENDSFCVCFGILYLPLVYLPA